MNKIRYLLFALLAMTMTVQAEPRVETVENDVTCEAFTFRGYEWGATLDEVREKEIKPEMLDEIDYYTTDDQKVFVVAATVSSVDMLATFEFDDDGGLVSGVYTQKTPRDTDLENYSDFLKIDTLLSSKYGDVTLGFYSGFRSDLAGLQTSEVIDDIISNGAVILNCWMAEDLSCILHMCTFSNGTVHPSLAYTKDADIILNLLDSLLTDTSGL